MTGLTSGVLGGWRGLPARCTRADVEAVLSPVSAAVNPSAQGSGPVSYAATAGAPYGLTVHYDADTVEYITVVDPHLERPVEAMLGEPEERMRSGLEGAGEQWVYARLGLAFHMKSEPPGVSRLYVFSPTTIDTYRTSPLSRVRTLRHQAPRTPAEE